MRAALCQRRGCNYQLRGQIREVLLALQPQGGQKPAQGRGWDGCVPGQGWKGREKGAERPLSSPFPFPQTAKGGLKQIRRSPASLFFILFFGFFLIFIFLEAACTALPFKWSRAVYLVSGCDSASAFGAGAAGWEGKPAVSNKCPA